MSEADSRDVNPAVPRALALDLAGFAAALALFAVLGLSHLGLPGLYQDEALDAAAAVRLLLRYQPWPYTLLPGSLALPIMVSDHVGPTSIYLLVPFLLFLGIDLTAVRVYEFTAGLAAIALVFLWARRVVMPGFAGIAALLLAATPSFWLACRNGIQVSFAVVPIGAGALICGDQWFRTRRPAWLHACFFLLGLGLSTKMLFLWLLVALAAGLATTRPSILRSLQARQWAIGALWFAAGAAPFLAFLVLSRGLVVKTILANMGATAYGVRNAAVAANLWTQLHSFARILDGGWLTWAGCAPRNPAALALFTLAAAYIIARRNGAGLRRLRFAVVAVVVVVAASCFTITTLGPKHLVVALPLIPVVTAGALGLAWDDRARCFSRVMVALLAALCAVQFGWDIRNDGQYLRTLTATEGTGLFSSAHDRLAQYLAANGIQRPLAGDWGFESNVEVLTKGRVLVKRIFELREPRPFTFTRQQARNALKDPDAVYLFHAERTAAEPGRLDAFLDEARAAGVPVAPVASFADGRGEGVIVAYQRRVPDR